MGEVIIGIVYGVCWSGIRLPVGVAPVDVGINEAGINEAGTLQSRMIADAQTWQLLFLSLRPNPPLVYQKPRCIAKS